MARLLDPTEYFRTAECGYARAALPVMFTYGLGAVAGGLQMRIVACELPVMVSAFMGAADVLFGLLFTGVLFVPFVVVARLAGERQQSRVRLVKCLALSYWMNVPIIVVMFFASLLYRLDVPCIPYDRGGMDWFFGVVEAMEAVEQELPYWGSIELLGNYSWLLVIVWQCCALRVVSRCRVSVSVALGALLWLVSGVWFLF